MSGTLEQQPWEDFVSKVIAEIRPSVSDRTSANVEVKSNFPAIPFDDLLVREFPARPLLLEPWLQERSTSMVYGPRGVGKSFLTLSIAIAVADQREFLGWKGKGKSGVLYVDGEMAADDLQRRLKELAGEHTWGLPLYFMSRDAFDDGMPTLNKQELRSAIEHEARRYDAKLIIIDNLSTLWRGVENDAESWDMMQDWLFKLRRAGHSVLLVHHAGKNGTQRGTSRKEDALDVVVALSPPCVAPKTKGAAFDVKFEKRRALPDDDTRSFHAHLRAKSDRGLEAWERNAVAIDENFSRCMEFKKSGKSQRDIAKELGVDESTVSRYVKKARAEGLLAEDGEGDGTEEDGGE